MELKYKPSQILENESFYVERKKVPYFGTDWHYHEEHEIIFMIKGQGVRIVGDHMDHFNNSELVMMGGGIPHLFKNNEEESNSEADFIVVKFNKLFKEESFFSLPELAPILSFIKNSKRGLLFSNTTISKIRKPLINLAASTGADRIIKLIMILDILTKETDYNYMASEGFQLKDSRDRKSVV